jgi:hypothetical protein
MSNSEGRAAGRLALVQNARRQSNPEAGRSFDPAALSSCLDASLYWWQSSPADFAHEAVFFPLGFPLRVVSNSLEILAAAEQSWGCFPPAFSNEPFELRIGVSRNDDSDMTVPPAPLHSFNGDLLVNAADTDNFCITDLKKGRAVGWVSKITASSTSYLRYHILEAAALSMIATLRAVALHGACVRSGKSGVLLCGDSGAGKSSLSFAGARAGWTFVCDDSSYLVLDRDDRLVVGNCHQVRFRPSAVELFPEIEGRPITPRATGKPSIEVRTSEWPELSTAGEAQVEHIVFLNRSQSDRQELVSVPPATVLPWFTQHLMATGGARLAHEAALSRLLQAGVFELRYRNLEWAIERIDQLAVRGR